MSTFEIVRGVEGDCLVLNDTRICGPKPWGGGRIIKTFRTDGVYEVIDKDEYRKLMAENARLRELVSDMMRFFEDGDWCDKCNHARECDSQEQYEGDCLMRLVFRERMRELGMEVEA